MTTAELIRNDNAYRAVGGECWYATFEIVRHEETVRHIKPIAMKVKVLGRNNAHSVFVCPKGGIGKVIASNENLFDNREHAQQMAVANCDLLDGTTVRGFFTYRVVRPKAKKAKEPQIELRVRQVTHDLYVCEYRDVAKRKWISVTGFVCLTRWKANDTMRRIANGHEVPGFWQMPGTMEWIELADNVE